MATQILQSNVAKGETLYLVREDGSTLQVQPVDPNAGNGYLWGVTGSRHVYGFSPSQLLAGGAQSPLIDLDLTTQITPAVVNDLSVDFYGNLWLAAQGGTGNFGATLRINATNALANQAIIALTLAGSVTVVDGQNTICLFDKFNNLWRGGQFSIAKISQRSLAASGTPIVVARINSLAGGVPGAFGSINRFGIFDGSGNYWQVGYPTGSDTLNVAQIAMWTAAQMAVLGSSTPVPAVIWSGSNFAFVNNTSGPYGIAFAPGSGLLWNTLYVTGAGNGAFRAFDPTIGSGNPAPLVTVTCAAFSGPDCIAFDNQGGAWVGNNDNGVLNYFLPTTLATSGLKVPDRQITTANLHWLSLTMPQNADKVGILPAGAPSNLFGVGG